LRLDELILREHAMVLPITEIPHSRSPKFPSGPSGAEDLM
jgi:hypothetical protein